MEVSITCLLYYFSMTNLMNMNVLEILAIVTTSVERGCAPQLDVFQAYDFSDKIWRAKEEIVQSAYQPGCFVGEDRGSPGGPPEYCYCSYNLCNGAENIDKQFSPLGAYIPSLIIIMQGLSIF